MSSTCWKWNSFWNDIRNSNFTFSCHWQRRYRGPKFFLQSLRKAWALCSPQNWRPGVRPSSTGSSTSLLCNPEIKWDVNIIVKQSQMSEILHQKMPLKSRERKNQVCWGKTHHANFWYWIKTCYRQVKTYVQRVTWKKSTIIIENR